MSKTIENKLYDLDKLVGALKRLSLRFVIESSVGVGYCCAQILSWLRMEG